MPSEEWPPYKWVWSHLVLARDPVTGEPTPYTHGVRRNKSVWVPIFLVLAVLLVVYGSTRRTRVHVWVLLVLLVLGFLGGHFFWCGS